MMFPGEKLFEKSFSPGHLFQKLFNNKNKTENVQI